MGKTALKPGRQATLPVKTDRQIRKSVELYHRSRSSPTEGREKERKAVKRESEGQLRRECRRKRAPRVLQLSPRKGTMYRDTDAHSRKKTYREVRNKE